MQIHWAGGVHTELKVRKNKGGHTANATDEDVVEVRELALPKGKAEAVIAALSISNVADAEDALSAPLNSAEAIYRSNLDMKAFHQEVVRVVLLDTQNRCITKMDIARGTVNQSLAHPREIFRPAIIHSAYAFVIVHNLWAATHRLYWTKPLRGIW
jgi:DNA repair protein RadC